MAESILGIKRTKRCGEFNESDIGKVVCAMGWVQKCRNKGGLIFIDLRDRTGIIQIVFDEKTCDKSKAHRCYNSSHCLIVSISYRFMRKVEQEKLRRGVRGSYRKIIFTIN